MTSKLTQHGIQVFKSGDKHQAQLIFKAALKADPQDEIAWYWLAATYSKPANRIKCLQKLLAINPHNQAALKQLARLQGKPCLAPVEPKTEPAPAPVPPASVVPEQPPALSPSVGSASAQPRKSRAKPAIFGLGTVAILALAAAFFLGMGEGLGQLPAGKEPTSVQTSDPAGTTSGTRLSPDSLTTTPPPRPLPGASQPLELSLPTLPAIPGDYPCLPQNTERVQAKVIHVVDGDTIDIEYNGKQYAVRYIGIDTPETGLGSRPKEYFSEEATRRNEELVGGQTVTLIKDISNTDQYGRLLRYVLVGEEFVNYILVNDGYAHSATFPPDIACVSFFEEAQQAAHLHSRGLWENIPPHSASSTPPSQRTPTSSVPMSCPYGCKEHYPGCDIKGNINHMGEKIYHLPGSEWYEGTIINPAKEERWFCTVKEAEKNGWRAAK